MYQKVTIVGRLGKDPVFKPLNNDLDVCSFSVAVTKKNKDKEITEWFNCNCWQKLATVAKDYLAKGSLVLCEGELKTSTYKDNAGVERYRTDLNVYLIKMLSSPTQAQEKKEEHKSSPAQDNFFNADCLPF